MYIKGVSESRVIYFTGKEFLALEELVNKRLDEWKRSTSPKANETKSPPPSLDDIQVTDLCDRIGELESRREGVDPGQLHSQFPITNIIALQNRVTSIEQHIQDNLDKTEPERHDSGSCLEKKLATLSGNIAYLNRTATDRIKALENKTGNSDISQRLTDLSEALDLDSKAKFSRLEDIEERLTYVVERITALEETLRPIKEEYDRFSFHDNTNVYARLNSMDKRIRNLASQTEGDE